jgi:hypothetical protein
MHRAGMRCPPKGNISSCRDGALRPPLCTSHHQRGVEIGCRKVSEMGRFLVVAILGSVAFAQASSPAGSKPGEDQRVQPASRVESALSGPPDLPPVPRGKSTVIGGAIRGVDRVRDQFTLNVYGGQTFKVLFDQRTRVYRDGVKSSLRDLRAGDHVSVETVLDGTTVFARSLHLLSGSPEGECQGQVMNYNPANRELTVRDVLSHRPVQLRVPVGTAIVRQGQAASSSADSASGNLAAGTLISVKFQSDNKGHGVASQIDILASPGSAFVFVGNIVFLDLHSGLLALVDPRDDKRYEVSFDSARLPMSRDLHEGADVTLTAEFDGSRYVARAVTINAASDK